MKKKLFEIFTREHTNAIPPNLILVKHKFGWLFLENEGAQWFVNHTNTFDEKSKETNDEMIRAIVKQIKFNKEVAKAV